MTEAIATKKRTREILERYGLQTKKRFGQNFIVEPGIIEKIGRAVAKREPEIIIEIGPGIGALTQKLTQSAEQVKAFEIDRELIPVLENEIGADNLEIIAQDFLECDVDEFLEKLDGKIAFASNLPYYITTPILFKLFEAQQPIDSITVMMQKEVADRFAAKPGSKAYNALSIIVQYLCDIEKVTDVNRNVFWPSPNVDSTVLQFVFKDDRPLSPSQQKAFFALVKACFKQRRKTLNNNLSALFENKEEVQKVLEKAGLDGQLRAQQLVMEDFLNLYRAFEELELDGLLVDGSLEE